MGQITQNGITFDSDWIDEKTSQYKDASKPWGERMGDLKKEIAKSEEDRDSIKLKTPNDQLALAATEALLSGLQQAELALEAELWNSTMPGRAAPPDAISG